MKVSNQVFTTSNSNKCVGGRCLVFARATHQLLSHDLTNVIYEVVTVQGGGR